MKDAKFNKIQLCVIHPGESLGNFLKELLGCSNQLLKDYYSKKQLTHKLRHKDELELAIDLVNKSIVAPVYENSLQPRILAEDERFLVLEKPFGIHGHPLLYSERSTVLNYLRQVRSDINWESFIQAEKGLLYRLDADTSGLLIFCREAHIHQMIRGEFHENVHAKTYYALVGGEVTHRGVLSHHLESFGERSSKVRVSDEGQPAELEILDAHYVAAVDASLVKISLHTGLRHQIRVQMQAIGHSIIGDELYGGRSAKRLYLHCYSYQVQGQVFTSNHFALLADYLGLDSGLEVFGDKLLIT